MHSPSGVTMDVVPDPVYSKVQENLVKKHEEEKEGMWQILAN